MTTSLTCSLQKAELEHARADWKWAEGRNRDRANAVRHDSCGGAGYPRRLSASNPVEGMFSYAPARLVSASLAGFARPYVHRIPLSPDLPRNFKVWEKPQHSVKFDWQDVTSEVVANGLRLGVRFDLPGAPLGGAI